MHNDKLISSDNVFSILLCISSIPAALFTFKFLNFFSTMNVFISVSISLEPFLSSNCCMGFVIDSILSFVKTELKELFRIFALFLSAKLNSPCLSTNGANLSLVLSGRLRWYGHVMRKGDEDWVKYVWSIELKAEDHLEDQERHG